MVHYFIGVLCVYGNCGCLEEITPFNSANLWSNCSYSNTIALVPKYGVFHSVCSSTKKSRLAASGGLLVALLRYLLRSSGKGREEGVDRALGSFLNIGRTAHWIVRPLGPRKCQRRIGIDRPINQGFIERPYGCLLYTSPSPRDRQKSRMPSSA